MSEKNLQDIIISLELLAIGNIAYNFATLLPRYNKVVTLSFLAGGVVGFACSKIS